MNADTLLGVTVLNFSPIAHIKYTIHVEFYVSQTCQFKKVYLLGNFMKAVRDH